MEKKLVDTIADSEDSSTVSCISGIEDNNEISKEKEDELLYNGAEEGEEGDDEDVLSDDSLRLRLSDDEDGDAEQNDTTNLPNISELKLQDQKTEQPATCVILDKELCSTLAKTVEEGSKVNEEPLHCDSAIDTLDKTIIFNESEKHMSNNSPENISITVGELLDEKYSSECNAELTISEISNVCSKVTSEHIKLKTDNLSANNYVQPSNLQKSVLEPHNEDNLKQTVSDHKEINSACKPKVNNVIDPVKVTCNNEKSFTMSDSTEDNLNDKVINGTNTNNSKHSANHSLAEINNSENSTKDNNDISVEDHVQHKYENQHSKHKDIIQSKNEKTQPMQEELKEEQNDNVKYKTTSTENSDTNKFCSDSISMLKTSLVTSSNVVEHIEIEDKTEDANTFQEKALIISSNIKDISKNTNADVIAPKKKRAKRDVDIIPEYITEEDKKERQKRKTAKNAEEIIRKKYLNNNSDSSDTEEDFVTVNHKLNRDVRSVSPSLKRNLLDKSESFNGAKKVKIGDNTETIKSTAKNDIVKLAFVEKLYQRDIKETLTKLTQKELEEFVIQKIAETITMRSEIGQLREQARITEKLHEATRTKLQQLMKQMKDFETVLSRNATDRRQNGDKPVAPIKINRSVGLQVNFITEHGMQNLRQVQQASLLKPPTNVSINSPSFEPTNNNIPNSNVPKRGNGVKIRSPRPLAPAPATSTTSQNPVSPIISTVTPAALVVAKPMDSSQLGKPIGVQPILSAPSVSSQQTIVLNGNIQGQIKCPPLIASKLNNDLIDLTDEEEKNKSTVKVTTVTANSMTTNTVVDHTLTTKPAQAQAFSRLIQTIPANVTITTPPTNLRLIAPNPATPTAIVNNINTPRLAYMLPTTIGSTRQVIITSNSNQPVQIRPATANRSFSTVTYKAGVSPIANGNVRVLNTATPSNVQHPAPLPDTPTYAITPGWKLPPPAPSLKITKVSNGIVLSWNMTLSDVHADIASYQLYAYQEIPGVNPSTSLWKKVGDVRALPLPMACTLTQFSEGNNYYFAVRAVDTHSRKGQYSTPGNISL